MFETIEVVCGSRVAVIWLNRPEVHNALNEVMVKELTQAIEASAHDEQINAIVLASRGDSFCSGTDLSWCRTALDGESGAAVMMTAALVGMLNAIETSPVPVIARVNGHCATATRRSRPFVSRSHGIRRSGYRHRCTNDERIHRRRKKWATAE